MTRDRKNKQILIVLIVVVAMVIVFVFTSLLRKEDKNCVLLNAHVTLNDGKLTITNKDTFDYVNTVLLINNHYHLNGFNLIAGETSTLWQIEFSNNYSRRMYAHEKVIAFSIVSNLPEDVKGVYYIDFTKSNNR